MIDEWDDASPEVQTTGHVTGGRYRLPYPDGRHKPYGWMRASNLAGAISDQKQLQDWEVRIMLLGARWRPDILDELIARGDLENLEPIQIRKILADFAARLKEAGHGNVGANRGNLRHAAIEAEHAGLPFNVRPRIRIQVDNYVSALAEHGLTPVKALQERIILQEEYGVAGKLDNVVWDDLWGVHRIADLKTQKRFYTWLNIVIQLWLYGTAPLMWDETSLSWVDTPVQMDPTTGLVAWMPYEHPERPDGVDVYEVDLYRGKALADLALQVVNARSAAKSKRRPWGTVRPVPDGTLTRTERYARRLESADSEEEIRSLWRTAKLAGVPLEALRPTARKSLTRVATN